MQKLVSIKCKPHELLEETTLKEILAQELAVNVAAITGFYKVKESIDARNRYQIWVILSLQVFINEDFTGRPAYQFYWKNVNAAKHSVVIVGAGPAGLFAALKLIEQGIKPIIIERGKEVRARRRDLAALNKEGIVNPESNYCFGEGGAGTYSDGKLYTRSSKRGDIHRILQLFVHFGANEKILYQAHPHIGTNKLPHIIAAMRQHILDCGGEVHFEKKLTDIIIEKAVVKLVVCADGTVIKADNIILATGHSARDIFTLLNNKNIAIEAKPFALGVRVEHPQGLIDTLQYKMAERGGFLPPASYSLVQQVQNNGVFSFCMCPGGIIAPAATNPNELVVNGWSPSKRNNPFANSGMVVTINADDAFHWMNNAAKKGIIDNIYIKDAASPLLLMYFQRIIEEKAFAAGGGKFVAPAQRMVDFYNLKQSANLPDCSYIPGVASANLHSVLPSFVAQSLRAAFQEFGKKMNRFEGSSYFTNEAVLVATESRTSSPVRIPRNADTLEHTQVKGLYPCAEGAGYAGGIVSAAMDGERVAAMITQKLA